MVLATCWPVLSASQHSPATLHTCRDSPIPPEGSRAAKDSSLVVFISHPAWLSLHCSMAVPSASQTQVPTALGLRSLMISGRRNRIERPGPLRPPEVPWQVCLCQGEPCVSEGADECDLLPVGGAAGPCELGSWGEVGPASSRLWIVGYGRGRLHKLLWFVGSFILFVIIIVHLFSLRSWPTE